METNILIGIALGTPIVGGILFIKQWSDENDPTKYVPTIGVIAILVEVIVWWRLISLL